MGLENLLGKENLPILHSKGRLAELMMIQAHYRNHEGVSGTLAASRAQVWISGQESSQELRPLQNEARQVTNPADGGLAGREAGRGEQTLPIHLSGPDGAHPGEGDDKQEGHHEGMANPFRMPVNWGRPLRGDA